MNEKKSIGLAVTSMILGIISLLFGCCFWYITIPAAILAVILASVSLSKKMGGTGMAIAGLVTSIISLVPAIIIMITGTSIMAFGNSDNDSKTNRDNTKSHYAEVSDITSKSDISVSSWYLDKDDDNNDIIIVKFKWKNRDDRPTNFSAAVNDKVFQNGTELKQILNSNSTYAEDKSVLIEPNETYYVESAFALIDNSEIKVVATDCSNDLELLSKRIELDIDKLDSEQETEGITSEIENNNTDTSNNSSNNDLSVSEIQNMIENGDYSLVTPEFKETMDSYEAFYDDYIDFMQKCNSGEIDLLEMMDNYTKMLTDMEDWTSKIESIDEENLSPADSAYYTLVTLRVSKKLLDVVL